MTCAAGSPTHTIVQAHYEDLSLNAWGAVEAYRALHPELPIGDGDAARCLVKHMPISKNLNMTGG